MKLGNCKIFPHFSKYQNQINKHLCKFMKMYSLCCDNGSMRCTKGFPFWHCRVFLFVCLFLHIIGCLIYNKAVIFFWEGLVVLAQLDYHFHSPQTADLFHCRFCFFKRDHGTILRFEPCLPVQAWNCPTLKGNTHPGPVTWSVLGQQNQL